jgi:hypothetical protein
MAGSSAFLLPILGVLSVAVAAPFLVVGYRRMEHRKRRRLEQSRREIRVRTGDEAGDAGECGHRRSKSKARQGTDGTYRSVCKYCGAAMKRLGPENWIVDRAAETGAGGGATP